MCAVSSGGGAGKLPLSFPRKRESPPTGRQAGTKRVSENLFYCSLETENEDILCPCFI